MANAWGLAWGHAWGGAWGLAAVVASPAVIGAGSSNEAGGLMLYAAMRMAEATRRRDERAIETLVKPATIEAPVLVVVAPIVRKVVRPVKRVTRVRPLELHDPAVDKVRELRTALDAPKPEVRSAPALVYPDVGYADVPLELVASAPPTPLVTKHTGVVAFEHATQFAEQQREALEEEELAMVFLLAA